MLTEAAILENLKDVYDPEIPVNIVDLGLIYGLDIQPDGRVHITMTMTFPGCPASAYLHEVVRERVEEIPEVTEATVEVVWDPPWSPEKMSLEAKRMLGFEV